MGARTKIEWADATWNLGIGCMKVSPGCANCYAEKMAARFMPKVVESGKWTGEIEYQMHHLEDPLKWRWRRLVFVNSMSDTFLMDDNVLLCMWAVMAAAQRHTFMLLTKRPEAMSNWFRHVASDDGREDVVAKAHAILTPEQASRAEVEMSANDCLPNVWAGVSAEDQKTYDHRTSVLRLVEAAGRWVSVEPMLGPVSIRDHSYCVDWIVAGAETGPRARPADEGWFAVLRDNCKGAGIPYFLKQVNATRSPYLDGAVHLEKPATLFPVLS